jgi:hypothetical protein
MGEIKSTLDLVMEKTKHLTMSEKEKKEGRIRDAGGKIKGMIQKFEDGWMNDIQFKKELDKIEESIDIPVLATLLEELLEGLNLFEDNRQRLKLLHDFCGLPVEEILSALEKFNEEHQHALHEIMESKKAEIDKKHGISGSAVTPNLDSDSHWQTLSSEIIKKHEKILEKCKAALIASFQSEWRSKS